MKKLLIFAGAATALVLSGAPAQAATPSNGDAKAHVRIMRPLQLESVQDLDLGTVVMTGTGTWSATVGIDQAGAFDCDGGASTDVACSGTTQPAVYKITGTNNQDVDITVSSTITLDNLTDGTSQLTLNVDAPAVVNLGATGNAGMNFNIGGSIAIDQSTADGVYEGDFDVTADYSA
ncbi:MAG TPA: DUF4402 domain-containing protein [Sphingomicrobium sp.]|nr:DUF4402 domain-containing protein [Sphingomicrobium sp.]